MKKFGKLFLEGLKKGFSIVFKAVLLLGAIGIILSLLLGMLALGMYVVQTFGASAIVLYSVDIMLLAVIAKTIFEDFAWKDSGRFVGFLRCLGLLLIFVLLVGIINVALWGCGYSLLWIFGVSLSVGAASLVGIAVSVIVFLIWMAAVYIKHYGWKKSLELFVRCLGVFTILAMVAAAAVVLLLHLFV